MSYEHECSRCGMCCLAEPCPVAVDLFGGIEHAERGEWMSVTQELRDSGDAEFEDGYLARREDAAALEWMAYQLKSVVEDRDWHDTERAKHLADARAVRELVAAAQGDIQRLAEVAAETLPTV